MDTDYDLEQLRKKKKKQAALWAAGTEGGIIEQRNHKYVMKEFLFSPAFHQPTRTTFPSLQDNVLCLYH